MKEKVRAFENFTMIVDVVNALQVSYYDIWIVLCAFYKKNAFKISRKKYFVDD